MKHAKASGSSLRERTQPRLMRDCPGITGPQYFGSICLGSVSPQSYFIHCVPIGAASTRHVASATYKGECDKSEICVEQAKNEAAVHLMRAYCVSIENFVNIAMENTRRPLGDRYVSEHATRPS